MTDHLKTLCDGAKIHERTQQEEKQLKEMNEYRDKFELAMDDDLNTADAISAVFELVKFANTTAGENSSHAYAASLLEEIKFSVICLV